MLSDPEKRSIYDRFGKDGLNHQGMGGGFSDLGDIFSNFGDIFGDIFGFGGRQSVRRGADLRMAVTVSLADCLTGLDRDLTIPKAVVCAPCNGSGAKPGTRPVVCSTCAGRGQVVANRGFIHMTTTCPSCRGAGQQIGDPCTSCEGSGEGVQNETVNVKIPAGVDHGMKLRLVGQGEAGPAGAQPGDLYVIIRVADHPTLERHGDDLLGGLELSMYDAALGTKAPFETLDGTIELKVPAGSQPHDLLRVRGRGMPILNSGGRRGDLHIRLQVKIPKALSAEARTALESIRDSS